MPPNWRYDVSPAFQLGIVIIQPNNLGNNQESWACNSRDIRPTILYMGVVCLTMWVYQYDKAIVMWKVMIHLWILGHTMFRQTQLDFTYDLRRPADKLWVFNFIHEYHSFGLGCLWRAKPWFRYIRHDYWTNAILRFKHCERNSDDGWNLPVFLLKLWETANPTPTEDGVKLENGFP